MLALGEKKKSFLNEKRLFGRWAAMHIQKGFCVDYGSSMKAHTNSCLSTKIGEGRTLISQYSSQKPTGCPIKGSITKSYMSGEMRKGKIAIIHHLVSIKKVPSPQAVYNSTS